MTRVKLNPRKSKVLSTGVWTVELKVHSDGIPAGGGIRLLWLNAGDFADRNTFSPDSGNYDIRVGGVGDSEYALSMRWLYQRSVGPEITMKSLKRIEGGSVVQFVFGEKGNWETGHYPVVIHLQVYEDVRGDGLFRKIPEIHTLEVKPLSMKKIDVYTDAQIDKGGKAKMRVRFRDGIGNGLPVPQTAKVSVNDVPLNLTKGSDCFLIKPDINKSGFAKAKVTVKKGKSSLAACSNPFTDRKWHNLSLYFGEIHCHTAYSDGQRGAKDACQYARDDVCLDFTSVTDHDCHLYGYELSTEHFEEIIKIADEFNSPGDFVTIPGYEWSPTVTKAVAGHHNVYFRSSDNAQILFSQDKKTSSINGLLRTLREKYNDGEVMVIPHHPAAAVNAAGYLEPSLTVAWNAKKGSPLRLVEIYSKWGCSEGLTDFRLLRSPKKGSSVVDALQKGYKLGFTGGSDSHIAMPGSFRRVKGKNLRYFSSGIIGVWAREKTREAIFDALYDRRCYATSGKRSILTFSINGCAMGGDIYLSAADAERKISCTAMATDKIQEIWIVREGKVVKTFAGKSDFEKIQWIDREALSRPTWYYIRVQEESGEVLWASPIWVGFQQKVRNHG